MITVRRLARLAGSIVALATAAWLFWMTLRPNPQVASQLRPVTAEATAFGLSVAFVIGIVGNIIVFVPLGMGLSAALEGRIWPPIAIGGGTSLAIEVLQARLPSRVSSPWDFVLNTVGVALGALIVNITLRRIWRKND